ncbi:MAG TPA: NAD-dependent epimerase/dehydratase family protein, partial [Longimicrobiales bacterium]|nr:NAD-dependent epimerase/dehydratase family protein [Longimicrobiales bacterium]
MSPKSLHVVFGAGQVGPFLAHDLREAGHRVRVVKRTPADLGPGIEVRTGDAADAAFCREAADGAAAVYHCMNPGYDADLWATLLPIYRDNLVAAAGAAGARLVVLDNLYMLGKDLRGPITEHTPWNPCSRKGQIRADVAAGLMEAHERGDARVVVARGSDFYGPEGVGTHFGPDFWKGALAGKPANFLPNPDTPHTYHFIPDVAAALAALGQAEPDVEGRSWLLPCAPAETSREMVERFARVLGRPIRLRGLPRPLVKVVGRLVPMIREIGEMLYQWDLPFVVDDS